MTKAVLVLGAGLVARPLVHYLSEKGFKVIVASRTLANVEALVKGATNATAQQADVESEEGLKKVEDLTTQVDLVISMLPYIFHVKAAQFALKYNKHFLTTSYVSDAMRALDKEAKEKGLVFINECGVDPGTDHMRCVLFLLVFYELNFCQCHEGY
jgi:saccharopine dehydrogenase-like NADP-dependent oxidoreductase